METSLSPSVCRAFLGCQVEKAVDELNLTKKIISCHPSNLPLADHVDCFVALNRSPSRPEFSEALLGLHATFDGSMILFENVVQVLHRSTHYTRHTPRKRGFHSLSWATTWQPLADIGTSAGGLHLNISGARELLRSTDLRVKEISYRCGFDDELPSKLPSNSNNQIRERGLNLGEAQPRIMRAASVVNWIPNRARR